MKQFFENYGAVALGILALLVLIAMITPVGNIIKTSLQGTVHKFSSSINSQVDDDLKATEVIINNIGNDNGRRSDGKIYWNNTLVSSLANYTFDETGYIGITSNGTVFKTMIDLNIGVNGTGYSGGISGIEFDVYKNGELIKSNVIDFYVPICVLSNDNYKVILKKYPENLVPDKTEVEINVYTASFTNPVFIQGEDYVSKVYINFGFTS